MCGVSVERDEEFRIFKKIVSFVDRMIVFFSLIYVCKIIILIVMSDLLITRRVLRVLCYPRVPSDVG